MNKQDYLKAFIVGFFVPAFFLSILFTVFELAGWIDAVTEWDILVSPIFFGFYNIFYFTLRASYPISNPKVRYGLHGAILWIVVSLVYFAITQGIDAHTGMLHLLGPKLNYWWHATAVLYWPIIGYVWFAYIQKPISESIGLKV